MTLVKIVLERPAALGWEPARGSVIISASKRHNAPSSVHLPDTFRVRLNAPLMDGVTIIKPAEPGVAWADLEPSTADWVWKFDERVDGGSIRYKRLDQPSGEIEYDDLVEVDPKSFGITGLPPAWVAEATYLRNEIESIVVGGVTDESVAALIEDPGSDTRAAVGGVVDEKTTLTPSAVLIFENALDPIP